VRGKAGSPRARYGLDARGKAGARARDTAWTRVARSGARARGKAWNSASLQPGLILARNTGSSVRG